MRMQLFWRSMALVTLFAFISVTTAGCASFGRQSQKTTQEVIRDYEAAGCPSYDMALTASAAYYSEYEHAKSLEAARKALKSAGTDQQRALACAFASQACGAMGRFQEAGELALQGQRIEPDSAYLASLRLAFFRAAGNKIEADAAEATLRQVDPTYEKRPVFLVEAALVVLGALFVYTVYAHEKISAAPTDAEKQCHRDAYQSMLAVGRTVCTGLLVLGISGCSPAQ